MEKKTCKKTSRLVGVRVEADPPSYVYWGRDKEALAKRMESWAAEFHDFLRDHRSQDIIQLSIVRDIKDVCSNCHEEWETDKDNEGEYCLSCGAYVEAPLVTSPAEVK